MTKYEKQDARIADIIAEGDLDDEKNEKSDETLAKYFSFLTTNISFPCFLTGIEDFPWEESYILGGANKSEYEQVKKSNPSYKDTFELIKFEGGGDEQIFAIVKRQSDNKEFVIELDWLKAKDKRSKNHQILDDYAVWFVNS